eukprot:12907636-Prorocentrum_lima.AAC.1
MGGNCFWLKKTAGACIIGVPFGRTARECSSSGFAGPLALAVQGVSVMLPVPLPVPASAVCPVSTVS